MMLWEEGAFELKDPVARFIPSFADARVCDGGNGAQAGHRAGRPSRCASGTCSPTPRGSPTASTTPTPSTRCTASAGFEWGSPAGLDLAGVCDAWAEMPLLFQPGSGVELLRGHRRARPRRRGRLRPVARRRSSPSASSARSACTTPASRCATATSSRLAALYSPDPETGTAARNAVLGQAALAPPAFLSGGGGLRLDRRRLPALHADAAAAAASSTACACSARAPSRTWRRNHLPGGADLEAFGRPLFAETAFDGVGFGLGFSRRRGPGRRARCRARSGEFAWGGAASTAFYVDPRRGHRRDLLHPAAAVEHPPDPAAAAPARRPGAGGLTGAAPRDARGPQGPLERLHRLLGPARLRAHAAAGPAARAVHLGRPRAGRRSTWRTSRRRSSPTSATSPSSYRTTRGRSRPCARPGTR